MVLAVCSRDVKFYRWPSMQFLGAYEPPTDCMTIKTISWNHIGRDVLVVKSKGHPMLIRTPLEKGKQIEQHTLKVPQDFVSTGSFSKTNSDILAIGFDKGYIITTDVKSNENYRSYGKLSSGIEMLDFAHNDKCLLAGCMDGSIYLYNGPGIPMASFMVPNANKNFSTLKFSDYGLIFAGASREGFLAVWDSTSADCLLYSKIHGACITDVAFLENSVTSISRDGYLCIFDLRSSQVASRNNLDGALSSLAYIPNSNYVVVGTYNQLRCYDTRKLRSPFTTMLINNSGHIKQILSSVSDNGIIDETHRPFLNSFTSDVKKNRGDFDISSSSCGDSLASSVIESLTSEQCPRYIQAGYIQDTHDCVATTAEDTKILENADIIQLEKYFNNHIKQASMRLAEKMAQKFYTLRINASKQFNGMEYKIDDSWENFMEYLKSNENSKQSLTDPSRSSLGENATSEKLSTVKPQ